MNNVALVAINLYYNDITNNKILLNNNSTPILYYWNKEKDLSFVDSILNDIKVRSLIQEKIADINIYSNTQISYIYYTLLDQKENFTENTFKLQDNIKIDYFEDIIYKTLDEIAKSIYFDVFNAEYIERNNDPIIYDVYAKSSLINKDQLSTSTFLNYIRSIAYRKYNLSKENLDIIYDKAAEIIDKTKKYHEHVG